MLSTPLTRCALDQWRRQRRSWGPVFPRLRLGLSLLYLSFTYDKGNVCKWTLLDLLTAIQYVQTANCKLMPSVLHSNRHIEDMNQQYCIVFNFYYPVCFYLLCKRNPRKSASVCRPKKSFPLLGLPDYDKLATAPSLRLTSAWGCTTFSVNVFWPVSSTVVGPRLDECMKKRSIKICAQGRSDGVDIGIYAPQISPSKLFMG